MRNNKPLLKLIALILLLALTLLSCIGRIKLVYACSPTVSVGDLLEPLVLPELPSEPIVMSEQPVTPWEEGSPSIDDFIHVRMTCYTYTGNPCKNGEYPREGVCAYMEEYLGYTALVYTDFEGGPGELIGIYEIYDTGYGFKTDVINEKTGKPYGTLQLGTSIDIFRNTEAACYEFAAEYGDYAYIQLVKAVG